MRDVTSTKIRYVVPLLEGRVPEIRAVGSGRPICD